MTRPGRPEVGIVVITRDRRDRLLATLDRLTALPGGPSLLVVDNASSDGTADAVRTRHPGVRVLRLARNEGAVARNHGVAALETPYIAFSDDDSWWHPAALGRAARLLADHPRLGLLAAATLVGPRGEPDPINDLLAASPLGTVADLPGPRVLGFLACACVVRRRAFLEVGGFHPLLHFGSEERLLAVDLARAGWGLAYCPEVVAHHDPAAGPRPGRQARTRRNDLLTAYLRRSWPRAAAATCHLARDAVTGAEARRALASALPRLPVALRQRRRVPDWLEADLSAVEDGGHPVTEKTA